MEQIYKDVTKLQTDILDTRSQLRTIESAYKTDIAAAFNNIRHPLTAGQRLLDTLCSANAPLVARIEAAIAADNPNSPTTDALVVVPNQLIGLRASIDDITSHFSAALAATTVAINTNNSCGLKIMEVGQRIDFCSISLTRCRDAATALAEQAQRDREKSQAALRAVEGELATKRNALAAKRSELMALEAQKTMLTREMEQKKREMEAKEKERKEMKGAAIGTGVAGGVLLALAPFTFGITALAAVPTLIGTGYTASCAVELKDEVKKLEAQIAGLNTSLATARREISILETDCASVERQAAYHVAAMQTHQSAQATYQRMITAAMSTNQEIASAHSDAAASKRCVTEALPSLHGVRDALEAISVAVTERALEVETAAPPRTMLERAADMVPGRGGPAARRRKREMQRRLHVVRRVGETLERVRAGMPFLLEGGRIVLTRLDVEAWDDAAEMAARMSGAWREDEDESE